MAQVPIPTFAFTPDDNGSYVVTFTATDDDGGVGTDSTTITVNNVDPVAALSGPSSGVRGQTLSYTGSQTDPGSADTHSFTWTVTRNGNLYTTTTGSETSFSFIPTTEGSYVVALTVTDDDYGAHMVSQTVAVSVMALQDDPCHPGETALVIGGTTGADHIIVHPSGNSGAVVVSVNGTSSGPFTPTGRIIVLGQAGNDDIQIAGSVSISAWLFGEDGDDRLKGGNGHDVLLGGAGEDLLSGGQGRDLLIGGVGADRIVGNADDDILIAGSTVHDSSDTALCAIMHEWTSGRTYGQRVANLSNQTVSGTSRENGVYFLLSDGSERTVLDDDAADILTGSAGQDWFLFNADGDGTARDRATDLHAAEFAADLDWLNTEV